jgi:hypothetical protein
MLVVLTSGYGTLDNLDSHDSTYAIVEVNDWCISLSPFCVSFLKSDICS